MIESAPLARGVRISKTQRTSLDRTLLSLGLIEEEKLLRALASILSIPFEQNVLREEISNTLIESIGYEHLRQSQIVPRYGKNGKIEILTANPNDVVQIEGIEFLLEQKVVLVATLSKVIRYLLSENIDISSEYSEEMLDRETGRLQDDSIEGPVVQFVNNVLAETVESGGSDVHFESTKDGLRIRIRLHGILHTHPVDQSLNPSSVFARLKILAEMNVTERRRPQDGRIAQTFSGRPVDFRVS
ncbi:ATPase, T2SS/T4P/T4SS family, partial [Ekhidna sp.]